MKYTPHTEADIAAMLSFLEKSSLHDLFADIPCDALCNKEMKLPPPLAEMEVRKRCEELAGKNVKYSSSFLGAGSYRHFIPSAVKTITSRSEFYTAYTPYQAEASQGTLQAIFEFQSFMCLLTGMEVANASLYDGSTAVAEAATLAMGETRRKKLIVSQSLHPEYREVLSTYLGTGERAEIVPLPHKDGTVDIESLKSLVDKTTAAVIVQNPNFFGALEPVQEIAAIAKSAGAISVLAVAEPYSLGLLKAPGKLGIDIVVGECQSFGIPRGFGGPLLGFMATQGRYMRRIPGRLCGKTVDKDGQEGFVLTLQAREQHIRRDKASSNICSNEALCALAATVHLSLIGRKGLREVAEQNIKKAHYAAEKISGIKGFSRKFKSPFFNEFVIQCPHDASRLIAELDGKGIAAGVDLGRLYPDMKDCLLVCVTEMTAREEMDRLAGALSELSAPAVV